MSRILIVGAGGVAAPFAIALTAALRGSDRKPIVRVCDDDVVERSNLHRQILFEASDVGSSKVLRFAQRMRERCEGLHVEVVEDRFTPDTVDTLLLGVDLVVDASDNFPTRFLIADASYLAKLPVIHAAAVRWTATVLASAPRGRPCYRCLFEDLPAGDAPDCATAGVLGPVCGVAGGIAAQLALAWLGGVIKGGEIHTYDGATDRLRVVPFRPRPDCALCGDAASIRTIASFRYASGEYDAPDECVASV
jgi:molybdopterin/thiamine biosynthesis adenylyltransferase